MNESVDARKVRRGAPPEPDHLSFPELPDRTFGAYDSATYGCLTRESGVLQDPTVVSRTERGNYQPIVSAGEVAGVSPTFREPRTIKAFSAAGRRRPRHAEKQDEASSPRRSPPEEEREKTAEDEKEGGGVFPFMGLKAVWSRSSTVRGCNLHLCSIRPLRTACGGRC